MASKNMFDVLIVGGSYAGLSAAMALGRSLRKVVLIDSGKPCNRQTPHSHNFLTQDGSTPAQISAIAREQVAVYPTVHTISGVATSVVKESEGFRISLENGESFTAQKLLLATGLKDIMPEVPGFADCWGISVLHCPYCHGYEVRNRKTGILANGEMAFELAKLISQWTKDLTIYTNGKAELTPEQRKKLSDHQINIMESIVASLEHENGYLKSVRFENGETEDLTALYARVPFEQHSDLPKQLGCEINENGFLKIDEFQRTSVPGVYAAGDNTTMFRTVSLAIASGTKAGAVINKELIDASF